MGQHSSPPLRLEGGWAVPRAGVHAETCNSRRQALGGPVGVSAQDGRQPKEEPLMSKGAEG